jgi:hypothetical protein
MAPSHSFARWDVGGEAVSLSDDVLKIIWAFDSKDERRDAVRGLSSRVEMLEINRGQWMERARAAEAELETWKRRALQVESPKELTDEQVEYGKQVATRISEDWRELDWYRRREPLVHAVISIPAEQYDDARDLAKDLINALRQLRSFEVKP